MSPGLPGRWVVVDPRFSVLAPILRHRRRLASIVITAAALFVVMALRAGVPAAGDQAEAELEPIGTLVPDDGLDPRILALDLDSSSYENAVERLEAALFAREETRRRLDRATSRGVELRERSVVLGAEIRETRTMIEATAVDLDRLESMLATRAVERFVRHGTDIEARLDPQAFIDAGRGARLSAEVDGAQIGHRATLLALMSELDEFLESRQAQRGFTEVSLAASIEVVDELVVDLEQRDDDIEDAEEQVAVARRSARAPGAPIGVIALDAYMDAEVSLRETDPECRLQWWMVAGVGRVESRHGELGGRRIRADGRVDQPIIGVALDGGPSVQLVRDTDAGRLDGDVDYDRAVGPMQFIPETWSRLGRDGNADGTKDPQNVYDAALAAATYLCQLASDLSIDRELLSAYHGYNASADYVEAVHDHALRYAALGYGE